MIICQATSKTFKVIEYMLRVHRSTMHRVHRVQQFLTAYKVVSQFHCFIGIPCMEQKCKEI